MRSEARRLDRLERSQGHLSHLQLTVMALEPLSDVEVDELQDIIRLLTAAGTSEADVDRLNPTQQERLRKIEAHIDHEVLRLRDTQ